MLARFRVRDITILASDSSPDSSRKKRADFGSAQNTRLLEGFFARTLVALAGADFLVLVCQKRDGGKTRSFSVSVDGFRKVLCPKDYKTIKADFQSVPRTLESLFTTLVLFHVRRHKM